MIGLDVFLDVIQTFGLPIALIIVLGFVAFKLYTDMRDDAKSREDRLEKQLDKSNERMDNFSETMKNFNTTLTKIDSRLETVEKIIVK